MTIDDVAKFVEPSERVLSTWRPVRKFGLYLSLWNCLDQLGELDRATLGRVRVSLDSDSPCKKYEFWRALGEPEKTVYYQHFLNAIKQ